jgi:hypothetical protein
MSLTWIKPKFLLISQNQSIPKGFVKISVNWFMCLQTHVQYHPSSFDPLESDVSLQYVLYVSVVQDFYIDLLH